MKNGIKYLFGEVFYTRHLEIAFFIVPFIAVLVAYALYRLEGSARKTCLRIFSLALVRSGTPQP